MGWRPQESLSVKLPHPLAPVRALLMPTDSRNTSVFWAHHSNTTKHHHLSPYSLHIHLARGLPIQLHGVPEQIPPAPSPQAATRAGHQGWSTNATDFISSHLAARCWKAGDGLAPALAAMLS